MEWAEKQGIAFSYIQPDKPSRMLISNDTTARFGMNG
jgi:hypothetical protein